jgi:hypothetical protein
MLKTVNCNSMAEFLDKLLPKEIRWENHLNQVGKVGFVDKYCKSFQRLLLNRQCLSI